MRRPSISTKESVEKRILVRRDSGLGLTYKSIRREDPSLEAAAQKVFGGWYEALDAAGIDSSLFRNQKPFGYWSRDRVIQEVRELKRNSEDLNFSSIRRTHSSLVQYAIKFLGGWYPALEAAGVDPRKYQKQVPPNYWSRETILSTLTELHSRGQDIRPIALRRSHPGLVGAARKQFKDLREMYHQAGIDPKKIGMQRRWTADNITTTLKELHSSGHDMKPYKLMQGSYIGLMLAGLRIYGSLESLYKAAGIELNSTGYKKRRTKKYTREEAISYLRELKERGEDISPRALNKNHYGLYNAVRKLFGSSWDYYEAAGLSPLQHTSLRKRGYWTEEKVIEQIKELDQIGEDLHLSSVKRNHIALERAAYKLFGSWHSACEAAGFSSGKYRVHFRKGHYTSESVIEQILQMKQKGVNLSGSAIARENPSLSAAAISRFGTWYKAIEAAGINPSDYRKEMAKGHWKKETIVNEIQTLGGKGVDLSYTRAQEQYPSLVSAAEKRFGSWSNAILNSGLNYDSFRKQLTARYWTKERMVSKLRELYLQGENIRPAILRKSYPGIYIWGRRLFGSVEGLYRESGIDPDSIGLPRKWTREGVVQEIRKRVEEGKGIELNTIRTEDSALLSTATRIFKNWFVALDAAGFDSAKMRKKAVNGYWTESLITARIKEMAARGELLSSHYAQKMHSDVYGGAQKIYGSWGTAVEKSGFDYAAIRKKHGDYSKEELMDFLVKLRKDGVQLAFTTVRRINPSMTNSIIKIFGSYRKGVESIGLNYDDVRKDGLRECYKGVVFERYAKRVFEKIGWKLRYNKLHRFKEGDCKPDFVDSMDGTWIDAKLDSFSWGVEETIEKYLNHCNRVMIVFLKGKKRIWPENGVDFVPISDFYMGLRGYEEGEELISNLENLKKGILRPELQAKLDKYQRKARADGRVPSEEVLARASFL